MTNEEPSMSALPLKRATDARAGSSDAPHPPSAGDGDDGQRDQEDPRLWVRLGLTRLPDGSGYTCVGRHFILTINTELDVEFEFDSDPSPVGLEESDLRAGLIALVLLVRSITTRLGTSQADGTGGHEVASPNEPSAKPSPTTAS